MRNPLMSFQFSGGKSRTQIIVEQMRFRYIMRISTTLFSSCIFATTFTTAAVTPSSQKLSEPVPLELVSRSLQGSTSNLSPDGQWVALVQTTGETIPWENGAYSKSGVPRVGGLRTRI